MTAKAQVLDVIKQLPEDATFEEIAREVDFIAKVKKGMEQIRRGEGISIEEVRKQVPLWATK